MSIGKIALMFSFYLNFNISVLANDWIFHKKELLTDQYSTVNIVHFLIDILLMVMHHQHLSGNLVRIAI